MEIKYVHTNIIAGDWRKLAQFYCTVFGCSRKLPERDLQGEWLNRATNINDARLQGIHLNLPGYVENGPTLEIFQYSQSITGNTPAVNRQGYGHLAFQVEDVDKCLVKVLKNGGSALGEVVTVNIKGAGTIRFVYALDPEGNIVELQKWKNE